MKRFIEVSKFTGGRTITQLYPAREVGTRLDDEQAQALGEACGLRGQYDEWTLDKCIDANFDMRCARCSYTVCSCPPQPVAPPPPADVLPEGWTRYRGHNYFFMNSDLFVYELGDGWVWSLPNGVHGRGLFTKGEAMRAGRAALASVRPAEPAELDSPPFTPPALTELAERDYKRLNRPAEPALRPGWRICGIRNHAPNHWLGSINVFRVDYYGGAYWRVVAGGHYDETPLPTLEAAMARAEALARGEW